MDSQNVRHLLDLIKEQNKALERVIAERDELRQHLENLAPGSPDAHACLRRIYNDPAVKDTERRAAAASAIGYEKPKPAATVNNVIDFKRVHATLETNWQKIQAERWAKVIEPPKPPLDLDAEPAKTMLGGANDEAPDPAA
jgi:hypothetical protein